MLSPGRQLEFEPNRGLGLVTATLPCFHDAIELSVVALLSYQNLREIILSHHQHTLAVSASMPRSTHRELEPL